MKSKLLMDSSIYRVLVRESKKAALTPDELNEVIVKRHFNIGK